MNSDNLDQLRKEIDEIDTRIIELLTKRMDVVKRVGVYKTARNIPPLDEKRWQEVLERIVRKAKERNLSEAMIKNIYEEIHNAALALEKKI
jgi:chorismate mutase